MNVGHLDHQSSRRRPVVAVLLVSWVTTMSPSPALALRAPQAGEAPDAIAQDLRPSQPPEPGSRTGLEEDVGRFALPPELSTQPVEALQLDAAGVARVQHMRGWFRQVTSVAEPYEAGLTGLRTQAWDDAIKAFQRASAELQSIVEIRRVNDPDEDTRIAMDILRTAQRRVGTAIGYAQARQASGPGLGFEYYRSVAESQQADPNSWSGPGTLYDIANNLERDGKLDKTQVVVRNPVRVFVTDKVRQQHGEKLGKWREEAGRTFRLDSVFQDYDPQVLLPPNAIVLTDTDDRPPGLRLDVAFVNVTTIDYFTELIQRALAYQLGQPLGRMVGAALINDKVFALFA